MKTKVKQLSRLTLEAAAEYQRKGDGIERIIDTIAYSGASTSFFYDLLAPTLLAGS